MTQHLYRFIFSVQAEKFLKKNTRLLSLDEVKQRLVLAVKKITKEENNNSDIKKLKGKLKEYYRLRIGEIRIMFTFEEGEIRIIDIDTIDFRGSIY